MKFPTNKAAEIALSLLPSNDATKCIDVNLMKKALGAAYLEDFFAEDHPEVDWEEFFNICIYVIQQLNIANLKNSDAPCSAEEHRSQAFCKMRDFLAKYKSVNLQTVP